MVSFGATAERLHRAWTWPAKQGEDWDDVNGSSFSGAESYRRRFLEWFQRQQDSLYRSNLGSVEASFVLEAALK